MSRHAITRHGTNGNGAIEIAATASRFAAEKTRCFE